MVAIQKGLLLLFSIFAIISLNGAEAGGRGMLHFYLLSIFDNYNFLIYKEKDTLNEEAQKPLVKKNDEIHFYNFLFFS